MEWPTWKGSGSRKSRYNKFKLELDRYLEVMEMEGYRDVDKIFLSFDH